MIDPFIPTDLAVAPNPLGRTPNLKLTTIPIDAYSCFELWMPELDAVLMPEEGMLLKGDRSRLEDICTKLIWLMGARLLTPNSNLHSPLIYEWTTVRRELEQGGAGIEAIGLSYLPQTLYAHAALDSGTTWTLQPANWEILPLHFSSAGKGVKVESTATRIMLTLGEQITRQERGAAIARN